MPAGLPLDLDDDFAEAAPPAAVPPSVDEEPAPVAEPAAPMLDVDLSDLSDDDLPPVGPVGDFGPLPGQAAEEKAEDDDDTLARISELMMSTAPEPIPEVFASAPTAETPRRGAWGLILLAVVLLISGVGVALYVLQPKVVAAWPGAARYYESLGIRKDEVGAGLNFRNYSSERQDDTLVVRGVIANVTDQSRDVPMLRLALYNTDKLLQEKIIAPPQTSLEAKGSVGFRITLDQPDPNATRFEVTFATPKPATAK